jgi:hypothetical protein
MRIGHSGVLPTLDISKNTRRPGNVCQNGDGLTRKERGTVFHQSFRVNLDRESSVYVV